MLPGAMETLDGIAASYPKLRRLEEKRIELARRNRTLTTSQARRRRWPERGLAASMGSLHLTDTRIEALADELYAVVKTGDCGCRPCRRTYIGVLRHSTRHRGVVARDGWKPEVTGVPDRKYGVYGPFQIPRTDDRLEVDRSRLRDFWKEVDEWSGGLAGASGCYVFAMRAAKGARPWYVGQAKRGFRQECFAAHKLVRYNSVIGRRQGTPILFLLARVTPKGKFTKKLGPKEANWVENLLIRQCLQANAELLNVSGTAFATEVVIPGVFHSPAGPRSTETAALRGLLNLD